VAWDVVCFRGAWSKVHDGVQDPFIAETLALRDSVLFARARGYQDWGARTSERTTIAPLLEEISSLSL
jgi:hypothetical protein